MNVARLARPGGWVACQEPDVEHALCQRHTGAEVREILELAA